MIKKILLCSSLISASCGAQSNKVEQIVNSGIVNLSEFTKVDKSNDSLVDEFLYRDDTSLLYQERFYPGREKRKGHSFYYGGKKIGKWIFFEESGDLLGEISYANDQKHGFDILYLDGKKMKYKRLYQEGKLVYEVNYDDSGNFLDSVSHSN